ncbi:hypothetical protein HYQ46_002311 [Verticillium longisporum]|nr:hypothetical protein HYQ46_002311 [Verticillium longisporum]
MEPKRIRHACSRCRRQKLRCDYQRPCPLCIRAGAQCTEATERTWRSNRPKSAAYQARHARPRVADEPCSSAQPDTVDAVELGRPKVSTATHAQPNDIVRPDQRASALHFVGKIFQKYQSQLRAAQFIGFNQEECWGDIDTVERQTRRYVWWSVFIGAGFISMSWGTPPMLIETDCHVQQPLDVEDSFEHGRELTFNGEFTDTRVD